MKASIRILIGMVFMVLTACATQEAKQNTSAISTTDTLSVITDESMQSSGQNPPMTLIKDEQTLNLVRIMDGGACKNNFQGAKGVFLVYANQDDIERIKSEQGPQIFSDFENKIQTLSTAAFQEAIDATNLAEDPFALGADEAQEKLAKQLFNNFRDSVADAIELFQQETTLTIDIVPFTPSFMFYQQGCKASYLEPED